MSVVSELIRKEADGTVSFGDYSLIEKTKLDNFEIAGDVYKVKTFKEITKLERNGMFVYESVPGTAVENFNAVQTGVKFTVEGDNDAQITLGLEENQEYAITIDGEEAGTMTTNLSGKLSISVELDAKDQVVVEVSKQ